MNMIKYDEINQIQNQKKNILVDNKFLYKIELEKEFYRRNAETGIGYTLVLKCFESGVNIQAVLPHEVLSELKNMIEESLNF